MRFGIDLGGMYRSPRYYLNRAEEVEDAGIDKLWFGDHFQPWFHTNGSAPFPYSWIPAALERTEDIPVGVFVTPPLYRYHPLIVANAVATIDQMYPGRFRFGVGTGERMSEHAFTESWPSWSERAKRIIEAMDIIEQYWSEDDFFGYEGEHFTFDPIYPYEQPESEQDIYFSATGPSSARIAADYADHLITISSVPDVKDRVIDVYQSNGGDGEVIIQSVGGFGNKEKLINRISRSFAATLKPESFNMKNPLEIEDVGRSVSTEEIEEAFLVAESADDVLQWVDQQKRRGADEVVITDISYEQKEFYQTIQSDVLPSV